jgi:hypothetical protein
MKIYQLTLAVLITLFLASCEDVIQVDLETAAPRLVIEASIQWQKGTSGNDQKVTLTTTTGFYSQTIPTVSGATVFITNSNNVVFEFIETPNSGEYLCSSFIPEIDQTYVLTVLLNGQTYTATETLKSVVPITTIEQNNEGGFTGEEIEIKTYFDDPADADNYYMFKYKNSISEIPTFEVSEDEFYQGNTFFDIYSNEDIASDDAINITIFGISKRYYEYMNKIISIAGSNGGSPFSTPPATVKGNIVNTINSKNYPLGYFNVSETDTRNYIIQ